MPLPLPLPFGWLGPFAGGFRRRHLPVSARPLGLDIDFVRIVPRPQSGARNRRRTGAGQPWPVWPGIGPLTQIGGEMPARMRSCSPSTRRVPQSPRPESDSDPPVSSTASSRISAEPLRQRGVECRDPRVAPELGAGATSGWCSPRTAASR